MIANVVVLMNVFIAFSSKKDGFGQAHQTGGAAVT
jgi:hypothetical protein